MSPLLRLALIVPSLGAVVLACAAEADPSRGSYTIQFPSTAAAIATDTVQLLVFDLPSSPEERVTFCEVLTQARKRRDPRKPALQNAPVNICEMLLGRKPITVPYGEKAVFAIAQRRGADFLVGCSIQTFGQGDVPLPIALALVDITNSVPETSCSSVGDFCDRKCPAE